jgi:hypothetical protein
METCADCGKPITFAQPSYYAQDGYGDIGRAYHSACGDPFGVKAAILAEREACAKIIEDSIVGYGANEPYLRPRPDGDVGGLPYAAAIRARSNHQG